MIEWLSDKAEATQRIYEIFMSDFCECVGKTPTEILNEAIKETKAGLLPAEKSVFGYIIKSRSHALRKYFASTLENAGMPKNKVDFMLGHVVNDVDDAYFQQFQKIEGVVYNLSSLSDIRVIQVGNN